jgi:hypothetical protein
MSRRSGLTPTIDQRPTPAMDSGPPRLLCRRAERRSCRNRWPGTSATSSEPSCASSRWDKVTSPNLADHCRAWTSTVALSRSGATDRSLYEERGRQAGFGVLRSSRRPRSCGLQGGTCGASEAGREPLALDDRVEDALMGISSHDPSNFDVRTKLLGSFAISPGEGPARSRVTPSGGWCRTRSDGTGLSRFRPRPAS